MIRSADYPLSARFKSIHALLKFGFVRGSMGCDMGGIQSPWMRIQSNAMIYVVSIHCYVAR